MVRWVPLHISNQGLRGVWHRHVFMFSCFGVVEIGLSDYAIIHVMVYTWSIICLWSITFTKYYAVETGLSAATCFVMHAIMHVMVYTPSIMFTLTLVCIYSVLSLYWASNMVCLLVIHAILHVMVYIPSIMFTLTLVLNLNSSFSVLSK